MNTILALPVLTVAVAILFSGFIFTQAYAEVSPNSFFTMTGSGYLATEESIKTSEINIVLGTGDQGGSRINIDSLNGRLTINDDSYEIVDYTAMLLREGKYFRLSATATALDNRDVDDVIINILGRLIQNSQQGSIYTFTGRIVDGNTEYKTIYIAQISPRDISLIQQTAGNDTLMIHILNGSSDPGLASSYIGKAQSQQTGYFSHDRLRISPGTTVTMTNDDKVSHRLISGTGSARVNSNFGSLNLCSGIDVKLQEGASFIPEGHAGSNCDFISDGRINIEIMPNQSTTITFADKGYYKLIDPDYPWMSITAYVFPPTDSILIRQGDNQLGN